jgi:hypothetical protein
MRQETASEANRVRHKRRSERRVRAGERSWKGVNSREEATLTIQRNEGAQAE